jgi:hypothetical protein
MFLLFMFEKDLAFGDYATRSKRTGIGLNQKNGGRRSAQVCSRHLVLPGSLEILEKRGWTGQKQLTGLRGSPSSFTLITADHEPLGVA